MLRDVAARSRESPKNSQRWIQSGSDLFRERADPWSGSGPNEHGSCCVPSAIFTMPSAHAAVKDAPRRFAVPPQSASLTAASLRPG